MLPESLLRVLNPLLEDDRLAIAVKRSRQDRLKELSLEAEAGAADIAELRRRVDLARGNS
ncbi:MAG: hypothetical protein V7746_24565 [Halioglobus sp.]